MEVVVLGKPPHFLCKHVSTIIGINDVTRDLTANLAHVGSDNDVKLHLGDTWFESSPFARLS
jgi:hypothetical protein